MQAPGRVAPPLGPPSPSGGIFLTPSAGSGVTLRAGALVSVEVLRDLGKGLYKIGLGSREFTAHSSMALAVGDRLQARVESSAPAPGTSGSLVLRIAQSASERLATLLSSLGLPTDAAAGAVLLASLAAGLKPETKLLSRLRHAVLEAREGTEGERAAFATDLEKKGIEASGEAVDSLIKLARGESDAGDELLRRESEVEVQLSQGTSEAEGQIPLAALFRELFTRNDPEPSLLALFNHAQGGSGDVLIPFALEISSIEFRGSFRVHLAPIVGGPVKIEGRFRVRRPEEEANSAQSWGFLLESTGKGSTFLSLAPPRALSPNQIADLRAHLEGSGCELRMGTSALDTEGFSEVDVDA